MRFRVQKSSLNGHIAIPPSKSHTLRAIFLSMMAHGKSTIHRYLDSPDSLAMINACRNFGCEIEQFPDHLAISGLDGKLRAAEDVIQAGNSGLVLRLVGALSALSPAYTILSGDHSIRHRRPVKPLLDALRQLGAQAESARGDNSAPLIIKGPLRSGTATLSGEDSQPVSGLLYALSFVEGTSHLHVTNPGEKPWIDLTLSWLKRIGAKITHENYSHYTIEGSLRYPGFNFTIPGDFSSAAFPLVAALITDSELTLKNLDMNDVQGDKKLIEVLISMGAKIEIGSNSLTVKRGSVLKGCRIDINDCIDALPILAVVGCFAEGTTEIVNGAIARRKESDRIHTITTELKKMGADIQERPDGLLITQSSLRGAHAQSHHDHRIGMALAVAALAAKGETLIEHTTCVAKTYPTFVPDFKNLGAHIEEI